MAATTGSIFFSTLSPMPVFEAALPALALAQDLQRIGLIAGQSFPRLKAHPKIRELLETPKIS
jgi:hypothetical protein